MLIRRLAQSAAPQEGEVYRNRTERIEGGLSMSPRTGHSNSLPHQRPSSFAQTTKWRVACVDENTCYGESCVGEKGPAPVVRYSISYGSILQVTIGHTLSHGVFFEIFFRTRGARPSKQRHVRMKGQPSEAPSCHRKGSGRIDKLAEGFGL